MDVSSNSMKAAMVTVPAMSQGFTGLAICRADEDGSGISCTLLIEISCSISAFSGRALLLQPTCQGAVDAADPDQGQCECELENAARSSRNCHWRFPEETS